jgi:hypothetical protein
MIPNCMIFEPIQTVFQTLADFIQTVERIKDLLSNLSRDSVRVQGGMPERVSYNDKKLDWAPDQHCDFRFLV